MKVAVLQYNSIDNEVANLIGLEALIREAAAAGAELVALPEVAYYRGKSFDAEADHMPGRVTRFCQKLATDLGIWIHGGTFAETVAGNKKLFNTSFLVSPGGKTEAVYRKVHLFDVDLPDLRLLESETFDRGHELVTAPMDGLTAGMLICYDLRFPGIWGALRARGADLFLLPVNFTAATGEAHWEVLLRARAIETQSYVAAPAQWGPHPHKNFSSYGRAMIVDPWGRIVAEAGREGNAVVIADVDPATIAAIRSNMPVHSHRRPEVYES